MNYKIKHIKIILLILFVPIIFSLYFLQIHKGEYYYRRSLKNILRLIPYPAPRGVIMDCNGNKLVDNFPNFQICLVPQEISNFDDVLTKISKQFDVSVDVLKKRFKKRYRYAFIPVPIIEDVEKSKAIRFEASNNLGGVMVTVAPKRRYLYDSVGSHVLGYLGRIDSSQFENLKKYGYSVDDYIGKSGLEEYFDTYLRGESGGELVEVDNKGNKRKILGQKVSRKGKDITLTIDIELQKFIEDIFADKTGAVIVMEPKTGYIRAMLSKPNFNPNIFLDEEENADIIRNILKAKNSPLLNRAISAAYPPGSIFKIVTATAGLEEKAITLEDKFLCKGFTYIGPAKYRCWYSQGHGNINLIQGLKYSCNVFFYKLGLKVGVDKLYDYACKMGLGKKTNIRLIGEEKGLVPNKSYKRSKFSSRWYAGDTANLSIGQGYITVTPIQALRMLSVVANKKFTARPKLVKNIEEVDMSDPELQHVDISEDTLDTVERGLVQVVESPGGTGRLAKISGITIAGKTGTAQVNLKEPHAWFLTYAPVEDPQICIVVTVEHGGMGGVNAVRIAKKIFNYYFKL